MSTVALRLTHPSIVAATLVCRAALADAPDTTAAETLFLEGRASVEAGDYPRACAAFAESLRVQSAPGALLNLADCEEHIGQLASSWRHFRRLEAILPASDERRQIAHDRASLLAPRVPWMTVAFAPDMPSAARVFRDGIELDRAHPASSAAVDPGSHTVLVVAPGRESRWFTVTAVERENIRVVASPGPVAAVAPHRVAPSHTAAWLVGAGGLVALGVGTYFGARALAERSISDAGCSGLVCASSMSLDAYEHARRDARASDVALATGLVGLVVSAALLITSRGEAPRTTAIWLTGGGLGGAW